MGGLADPEMADSTRFCCAPSEQKGKNARKLTTKNGFSGGGAHFQAAVQKLTKEKTKAGVEKGNGGQRAYPWFAW